MSIMQVSPTRMELSRLKKQLDLSVKGHKLLKDKQDELMRRFVAYIKENDVLRKELEKKFIAIREKSLLAKSSYNIEEVLPRVSDAQLVKLDSKTINIMGLNIPQMQFEVGDMEVGDFANSTPALRETQVAMMSLLPELLHLGQVEKNSVLLAEEIQKIRRRVNALEYITIPQLKETIRFIKMRLEDSERERITRLIKMEDMASKSNRK